MRWIAGIACAAAVLPSAHAQDLSPNVYIGTHGDWQPLEVRRAEGRLELLISPAPTDTGRVRLLVHPPAGMDINDRTPPRITGVKIDGKPKAPAAVIALGRGAWQPQTIAVGVRDRENAVAPESVAFEVDGRRYALGEEAVHSSGDTYVLNVAPQGLGEHAVEFTASDTSPQHNRTRLAVEWERLLGTDYCLASAGATLSVDSCFEGYTDLAPLQDGKTKLPGDHCLNDVSWASAETAQPHWVEVDFGQPRRITTITVYWAYYGGLYHTARHLEVQVPDGNQWRTVWSAPPAGLAPSRFTCARWGFAVTRKVRLYQPAGGGPSSRPDLMWLAEVMAE
jgi:hypothetical protein